MMNAIRKAGTLILISYFFSQGTRLAGNLITARLLAPEMFGVMAVILVIQQGVMMLSDVGLDAYIIRHKNYTDPIILNIVWTVQVLRGIFLAIVTAVLAGTLWFLQSSELTNHWGALANDSLPLLLLVSTLNPLMLGMKSLARLVKTRELNRLKLEILDAISQLIGTTVMIVWALYYPSVWALAVAAPITIFISVILSYSMFEIRHSFHFDKKVFSEIYQFGKWIFIATALTYFSQQGDRLFLSVSISEAELGLYSIALALVGFATMFVQRIAAQLWLPVFSTKATDEQSLKKNYYRVRIVQDLAVGAFVLLATYFANNVIDILYDERYRDVTWMLQLAVVTVLAVSIRQASKVLLVALGETKVQMQSMFVNLISLIILMPIMFSFYHLKGLIVATVISNFIAVIPQYRTMYILSVFDFWKEIRVIPLIFVLYIFLIYSGF